MWLIRLTTMNPLKIIFRYNKIQEAWCRSYQYQVAYFTISTLYNRNEISEEVYQEIRPKNAKIARAHGLPKVHKSFDRVPSFRHYKASKPSPTKRILTERYFLFSWTYQKDTQRANQKWRVHISLDVVSLFTNVPVNIRLNRVYKQKLIRTTL